MEHQVAPLVSILERRLLRKRSLAPQDEESLRALLDRMALLTNGLYPAITDLAREVRYRYFDQPQFEQARLQVYKEMEAHLDHLAAGANPPDRHERVRALIECPQPLASLLSERMASGDAAMRKLILEALTWRYYRIRPLTNFRCLELQDGQCAAAAEYDFEGKRIHVFTTHAAYPHLADATRALFPLIAEVPADHEVILDFYVFHALRSDPELTQQELNALFNNVGFPRQIHRIVASITAPGVSHTQHFTYRPALNIYQEEKLYRGIHPMLAKRLHLWRLEHFNIERLPSVEDVYLLHAVARDNPKDERLFACAEVRDVTPVKDENGRIHFPHLERMLAEALAGIRLYQSRRPPHHRLHWNRILLNVWPPFKLDREEFRDLVRRLKPTTLGLGLEQVIIRTRIPNPATGELREMVVRVSSPGDSDMLITFRSAGQLEPIRPLPEYDQKVVRMRQRGLIYPYEIIKMLTPAPTHTRARPANSRPGGRQIRPADARRHVQK